MKKNPLFIGVAHTNVRTADIEKSLKFYTEVLGFSLVKRYTTPMPLAMINLNGTTIEFSEVPELPLYQDGLVNHLAMNVSDIFATYEFLKNYGVDFIAPANKPIKIEGRSYYFFFRGPSGERIEIVQSI